VQELLPEAVELFENGTCKTVLPEQFRASEGRVLCMYGDAGWGGEVAHGKYETGRFSDQLVIAAAGLIQSKWKPEPPPAWITAVPSQRHPGLVRDFAQRLAARLDLPFAAVLRKSQETQPQKEMQNSVLQLRNLLGAFAVEGAVPAGPVLLVDDVTDSGWTLTWLAVILRRHGSGPVYPFALAKASPRGS